MKNNVATILVIMDKMIKIYDQQFQFLKYNLNTFCLKEVLFLQKKQLPCENRH